MLKKNRESVEVDKKKCLRNIWIAPKTIITKDVSEGSLYSVMKVHAIVRLVCYGIYFLTLIPVGDDSESHYEELLTNERLNERLCQLSCGVFLKPPIKFQLGSLLYFFTKIRLFWNIILVFLLTLAQFGK